MSALKSSAGKKFSPSGDCCQLALQEGYVLLGIHRDCSAVVLALVAYERLL